MTQRDPSASRRPRRRLVALTAALAVALVGGLGACSSGSNDEQASGSGGSTAAGGRAEPGSDAGQTEDSSGTGDPDAKTSKSAAKASTRGLTPALETTALSGRDVIRTADLTVLTEDVDGARSKARDLVADLGGVVASETTSVTRRHGDTPVGTRTARLALQVPTDSFDDAVGALSDLGREQELSIRQEDVTAEVADVESRAQSARTALDRVRTLLGRANKLGAIIQLEGVIADRQADLEALQARQRVLADQTQLATLRLELRQPSPAGRQPVDDEVRGFAAGIAAGWGGLRELVVGASTAVGVVLPFALVGAVVLLPLVIWRRRRGGLVTSSTS